MYKFSAPMPYYKEDIDNILAINKHVEKSKITSLYACVPRGCEVFTGFEQSRNFAFNNVNWDYWKGLIEYTLEKGCDFIYLLNSPSPLDIDNSDFSKQLKTLESLLSELKKIGVSKLRIANAQLMSYIGKYYPEFDVLASTSIEYKTIWEYQNFIAFHPEIKQIVPSHDVNKNFLLLKNLRKRYSDIELELIVNEGCLQGCPNRNLHSMIKMDKDISFANDDYLSFHYPTLFCYQIIDKYPIQCLIIGNNIFPFDIKEYNKIGIKNFKFVGRDAYIDNFKYYISSFFSYLRGVDNIKNILNNPLSDFTHHLNKNMLLKNFIVKKYKKYLPQIGYFRKYGHLCASRCGINCRYCYKKAEIFQNIFKKELKTIKNRTLPVCYIK